MRALVTRRSGVMESAEVEEPALPGPGRVLVSPEAVGVCGSDYHFLSGDLVTPPAFGPQYPRIQGHEVAGTIVELGAGCPPELHSGQRVAVYPLSSCGECYACRIGRENACPNFRLIGIHVDGALQERFEVAAEQVFPVGDMDPATAAFCEPMSIGVRALERGRVAAQEAIVVLGAGPIGQAVTIAARDRGAVVLLTDILGARLEIGRAAGAETFDASGQDAAAVADRARALFGGEGPHAVIDCTGEPSAIRTAVDVVRPAGRVVIVGISHKEVTLPVNAFTDREIDLLGSTVCTPPEFAAAVGIVDRHRVEVRRLITHRRLLADAAEAIDHAMRYPGDVMKLVISPDHRWTEPS
jgi:2-desacetyl-2-hydroxyethyl bacteriochlorophyllide A dehydrogenase